MKASKYIRKLAWVNVFKKKQRTLLSLVAISLSVAIIFTSLTLFTNIYSLTKIPNSITTGQYHYLFDSSIKQTTTRHTLTYDEELGEYAYYQDQLLAFHHLEQADDVSPIHLIEGSMPLQDGEIVVENTLKLKVGDKVTLDQGTNTSLNLVPYQTTVDTFENTESKTYQVVGIYEATDLMKSLMNTSPVYVSSNDHVIQTTIIAYDKQVHRSDSIDTLSEIYNLDTNAIYLNNQAISYDTVSNYLKDTTTLLIMFIAIVIMAILMSLISLKNVFIISDKDRKKEFGLLKSIGATPKDISKLLQTELSILGIVGAIIGLIFGNFISYFVLAAFVKKVNMSFNTSMLINPIVYVGSFIIGFVLMYSLGFYYYKDAIHSSAIEDLKDVSYNYDPPRQNQSYRSKSFSWKMFLIYNGRLKKQTRNIFQSFALLILTTVIFLAVFLSNFNYRTETKDVDYDLSISNSVATNAATPINQELYKELYQAIDDQVIVPKTFNVRRSLLGSYIQYPVNSINKDNLLVYKANARVKYVENTDKNGDTYAQIQTSVLLLDDPQIDKLKPYVVKGDLEDVKSDGAILILNESDVSNGLLGDSLVGDTLYMNEELVGDTETIKAVVVLPETVEGLYVDYNNFSRIVAFSTSYGLKYQKDYTIMETAEITLENKASITKVSAAIDQAIINSGVQDTYSYDNVVLRTQENEITSFIIESLLYPLFTLLFIISLLNINNVLIGNVHIKRGDISIMKSVGMTSLQLYKLFIYEYLEGYINASALVLAIFLPICFIEGKLHLTSAFKLGENILITILVSIMIVDTLLVSILAAFSLNKIRKVEAIENMKDVV